MLLRLHTFRTMHAMILHLNICIAFEKLVDIFFFLFCLILHGGVMPVFRLRHLANENIVSKISNEPLELGS